MCVGLGFRVRVRARVRARGFKAFRLDANLLGLALQLRQHHFFGAPSLGERVC